jgi:hypothetical protein
MKMIVFFLLCTFKLSAQSANNYTSELELAPDSLMIYTHENIFYAPEGNEIYWKSDYSNKYLLKKSIVQFPIMLIYFPIDIEVSLVSICNTTLVIQKNMLFLLLPGQYRVFANDEYQYIICKTRSISADDSSLALLKHVCFRPW